MLPFVGARAVSNLSIYDQRAFSDTDFTFDSGIVCEHPSPRLTDGLLECPGLSLVARGPCALCRLRRVLTYYYRTTISFLFS